MRLPLFRFLRNRPTSALQLESVRSIFSKFQRIQKLNTRALKLMAEMDEALGGEYVFDRAFLESSVRELNDLAYHVVYSLNAMSANRYVGLFDRFQQIKAILDNILEGEMGPFSESLTLPYQALGWEMEPLVGALNVCLAEARLRMDLLAPDGFAVTASACRLFIESNGLDDFIRRGNLKELERALRGGSFPEELEHAIQEETTRLLRRSDASTQLTVRACSAGGYGKDEPQIAGITGVSPEQIIPACRSAIEEYVLKAAYRRPSENEAFALAVHEDVHANVVGSISIRGSLGSSSGLLSITAASADAPETAERYFLRGVYPYELVASDVCAKPADQLFCSGATPLSKTMGLYRGSSLVEPAFLKAVAETAMTLERKLECMREVRWARTDAERPVVLDIQLSSQSSGDDVIPCVAEDAVPRAEVLLRGGETVQTGITVGRVVHISDQTDLESFPHGAVAVAKTANPRLTPILRRAAAVITEVGSSIGHLATVARELRVPAIFGMAGAIERIPDGIEVTIDAGDRAVLKGVVEPLLACRPCGTELSPSDPEYVVLRRLLRWIMPLDLVNPESEDFCAENCRTYHDIMHFSHERAVDELLHLPNRGRGLAGLQARRLDLNVPVELFVIDIGGGVENARGTMLSVNDVASRPFGAFLRGLVSKEMWHVGPAAIRLRDIFAGLDRTFTAMNNPPGYAGVNHAIVAESYMNLGLRLGYHFSVIDSYFGDNINQNYIYFRFVGGFADQRRRLRRAGLIRSILEDMGFKVLVKGDLVVGNLKIAGQDEMAAALVCLGQLTGFTRQLDTAMASDDAGDRFEMLFRQKAASCNQTDSRGGGTPSCVTQ